MIDILVENVLENTTFKSPSGNVDKLELNDIGKVKEVLLKMTERSKWEWEPRVRIITNRQFTDLHMGKWSPEEGYDYYSTDGDFLFHR